MEFNAESAAAFLRLILSLAVGVATTFGWTLDYDLWWNIGLSIIAVVMIVYLLWWKNNNLTQAAQESQKLLNKLKLANKEAKEGTD